MTTSDDDDNGDEISTANVDVSSPELLAHRRVVRRGKDVDVVVRKAIAFTIVSHLNNHGLKHGILAEIARTHGVAQSVVSRIRRRLKFNVSTGRFEAPVEFSGRRKNCGGTSYLVRRTWSRHKSQDKSRKGFGEE